MSASTPSLAPTPGQERQEAVDTVAAPRMSWLWRLMHGASALGIFLMMLVGFVDVVGRKFFDRPLRGAVEITEILMLAVVFMGVSLVSWQRNHIQLDLIDGYLPPCWQALRLRLAEVSGGLLMLGGAWLALTRTLQAAREHELSTLLQVQLAPAYGLVALLLVVAAIAHLGAAFGRTPLTADSGNLT